MQGRMSMLAFMLECCRLHIRVVAAWQQNAISPVLLAWLCDCGQSLAASSSSVAGVP
jgi:hypothetical protein